MSAPSGMVSLNFMSLEGGKLLATMEVDNVAMEGEKFLTPTELDNVFLTVLVCHVVAVMVALDTIINIELPLFIESIHT